MPYIKQKDRGYFDDSIQVLAETICSPGDLNYIITQLLIKLQPVCYEDYNAMVGVLECAKLEFYRRAIAKYEDMKIKENGDVY